MAKDDDFFEKYVEKTPTKRKGSVKKDILKYLEKKEVKKVETVQQDKLDEKDREILQESLNLFKNKIIAYNWAKELFSYNLSEEEKEKLQSVVIK